MSQVAAAPAEKVEYEVWERDLEQGTARVFRPGLIYSVAKNWAEQFGKEMEIDRFEYFAVKATTTYEEV